MTLRPDARTPSIMVLPGTSRAELRMKASSEPVWMIEASTGPISPDIAAAMC